MFDWNDEELRSIIWGEAGESNNHIDVHPKKYELNSDIFPGYLCNKETSEESSGITTFERKRSMTGSEHGVDLGEIPEKPAEDGEESDFVFCGLGNIGSFDDLDRIFSNNDSIFGEMAVANADELWPSSGDVTSLPLEFPQFFGDTSDGTIRRPLNHASSSSGYIQAPVAEGKIRGSHEQMNDKRTANLNHTSDKGNKQGRLIKDRMLDKRNGVSFPHGSSNGHFTSSALSQQWSSVANPQTCSSHLPSPFYRNIMSQNAASSKAPSMTPKEKIEKLRRRQQMRAVLAIQKQQQQQFSNQIAASSDIGTVFDNCSMEESALYQLQDAVDKLEMGVRLSVRDSLYRLSKSAAQRPHPNDTSSTCPSTGDEPFMNKDINSNQRICRFTEMPDPETKTNPIDRTVAHLLFHRPPELSVKQTETSESPSTLSSHSNQSRTSTPFSIRTGIPTKGEHKGA